MSRDALKNLIELVPDNEIEVLYKVIIKFIPSETPEDGEIEMLEVGKADRLKNGTIKHGDINWN